MTKTPSELDACKDACKLERVCAVDFNPPAQIPYGCTVEHIRETMNGFLDFLEFVNTQLHTKGIPRLERFLMPANFSSIVGEFMTVNLPNHCLTIVKNNYHNGHPDLLPKGKYLGDSILHADEGIEVKASRYTRGWQGHNPEDTWLMVFVFDANRANDNVKGIQPFPFRFLKVVGALLKKSDWKFSGRTGKSRRTITASVTRSGYDKMEENWIYRHKLDE